MRLTNKQKKVLDEYSVLYEDVEYMTAEQLNELLLKISFEMSEFVDDNDEPTEDFLILENLYDDIFYRFKEVD